MRIKKPTISVSGSTPSLVMQDLPVLPTMHTDTTQWYFTHNPNVFTTNLLHYSNNILINEQHGFRQRFSCETQLISAVHDWAKSINTCSQTDIILLDFSKAFDSVPHQRLLMKLDYYGIRGNMVMWIKAFLVKPLPISVSKWHSVFF